MQHYTRIRELGKGSFGKCYLVQNNGVDPPELCVIKQMDTSMMSAHEHDEAVKEASLLKKMNFPNIVRFQEVFMTRRGRLCICMEYCDGGDLHHKIKERNGVPLPEEEVKDGFIQLAFALRYVHENHILHRDLKSQNIFLHKEGQLKLGDFGIAKILTATKDYAKTMVGTPYYLSPEIIEEQPYNFRSDIWSLGVVLYEMLTLRHPFDANSLHFLAVKILNGKYPPPQGYSLGMEDLIRSMLRRDPQERPTAIDIVRNALFEQTIPTVNTRHGFGWDLFVNSKLSPEQLASPTSEPSQEHELASVRSQTVSKTDGSRGTKFTASRTNNKKRRDIERARVLSAIPLTGAAPPASADVHLPSSPLAQPRSDDMTKCAPSNDGVAPAKRGNDRDVQAAKNNDDGGNESKAVKKGDDDDVCLFASIVGEHVKSGLHHAHEEEDEAVWHVHAVAARMPSSVIAEEISEEEAEVYESDFESLSEGSNKSEEKPLLMTGSKVRCLREYLRQHATEDQFERAYTLVRTAPEANDLAEQVDHIFGSNTTQLFPLLQLLCFLEELQ
eukprot:GEMP01025059.1.p1 GENE.GEMP01025059.1~~GEMP01025059.1.p1  ORF type:complete len:556 (+),score=157.28 GEMP01025059.1:11-1678(+)